MTSDNDLNEQNDHIDRTPITDPGAGRGDDRRGASVEDNNTPQNARGNDIGPAPLPDRPPYDFMDNGHRNLGPLNDSLDIGQRLDPRDDFMDNGTIYTNGRNIIPDHHSDVSNDEFGFGNFNIPENHSDGSNPDNSTLNINYDHDAVDAFAPIGDDDLLLNRLNNSSHGNHEEEDIWNQTMEGDDDALDRLLADREFDDERLQNVHNDSYFDEDAEYDRLLDQIIPIAPIPVDLNTDEPRFLTEDELRRYLPEQQEIYRMATYFNEAVHIALPFDEEFDCGCTDHGLPPVSEGRRKRCASEPLPGPPKKSCHRIPDPTMLTLFADPPKKCYIEIRPFDGPLNLSISAEDVSGLAPQLSNSETSFSTAIAMATDADEPMDYESMDESTNHTSFDANTDVSAVLLDINDSYDNISGLNTARSLSNTSVDDLTTARAVSPLPVQPVQPLLPPPALALPAAIALPPTLEDDIEAALTEIGNNLSLISSDNYTRSPKTLDFVASLQRNRTTLRRLQKELAALNANRGTKTRAMIETAFEKVERKLTKLSAEIESSKKAKKT